MNSNSDTYLSVLQSNWLAANLRIRSYCGYETQKVLGQIIVDQQSATNLCTQRLDPIDADHISISKPADTNATSYRALKDAFQETDSHTNHGVGNKPPPPQQPHPPGQPVCAPGVINCNLAPNQGDQSIHINPRAVPIASLLYQRPFAAVDRNNTYTKDEMIMGSRSFREGDLRFNPGSEIFIGVDRAFSTPAFLFDCDVACQITESLSVTKPDENDINTENIQPDFNGLTADGLHHRISFKDSLGAAPVFSIELHIRSATNSPALNTVCCVRSGWKFAVDFPKYIESRWFDANFVSLI